MATTLGETRLALAEAQDIAAQVLHWLAGGYAEALVVGSVRRGKATVGDIEIALLPHTLTNILGERMSDRLLLAGAVEATVRARRLLWDTRVKANGDRRKRLVEPSSGVVVELYIADSRDNYGNTVAIRTGDAEFSHVLVTRREWGGLMPDNLRQLDGYLWRDDPDDDNGILRVPCPDEAAFFAALGLPVVPLNERTMVTAMTLTGAVKGAGSEVGQ